MGETKQSLEKIRGEKIFSDKKQEFAFKIALEKFVSKNFEGKKGARKAEKEKQDSAKKTVKDLMEKNKETVNFLIGADKNQVVDLYGDPAGYLWEAAQNMVLRNIDQGKGGGGEMEGGEFATPEILAEEEKISELRKGLLQKIESFEEKFQQHEADVTKLSEGKKKKDLQETEKEIVKNFSKIKNALQKVHEISILLKDEKEVQKAEKTLNKLNEELAKNKEDFASLKLSAVQEEVSPPVVEEKGEKKELAQEDKIRKDEEKPVETEAPKEEEERKTISKEEFENKLAACKTAQQLIKFVESAPGWVNTGDGLYNFADEISVQNNIKKIKDYLISGFGKEYNEIALPGVLKEKINSLRNIKKEIVKKIETAPKEAVPESAPEKIETAQVEKESVESEEEVFKNEVDKFKKDLKKLFEEASEKGFSPDFIATINNFLALTEKAQAENNKGEFEENKLMFLAELKKETEKPIEKITPAEEPVKKTGWLDKVKGFFGGTKESLKNKEVQDMVSEGTYKTVTSVLGIKFVTDLGRAMVGKGDIAEYVKQKMEDRTIRKNFEALMQSRIKGKDEELSEEERAEAASKFYTQAKNVFRAINESKRIDGREKQIMKEQLKTLARDYEKEKNRNEKEAQKATLQVIEAYAKNKVNGVTLAKDFLNTALTATGTYALRGLMYGGAAVAERYLRLKKENIRREVKGEIKKNLIKETVVGAFTETLHELNVFDKEKTKIQMAVDLVKAGGTLLRIAGIGGLAVGEIMQEGTGIIDKTLENIQNAIDHNIFEKGGVLNNFAATIDRLTLHSTDLSGAMSGESVAENIIIEPSKIETPKSSAIAQENIPESEKIIIDTTIHKGDGYYDVFRRQIEADPEKFGYQDEGDVDDFIERKTREFLKTNDLWKNGKSMGLRYDPEARIVLNPDGTFVQSDVETYRMEIPKPRVETVAQIPDKQAFDEAEMKIAENQMEINAAERIKMDANYLRAVNRIKADFGADQAQRLVGKMDTVYTKLNNLEELAAKHPVEGSDNLAGRIKDLKEAFLKAQTDATPSNYGNTVRTVDDIGRAADSDIRIIQNQTGEAMTEETFFAKGSVVGEKMTTGSKDTLASAVKELSEKSGLKGDKLAEGILEYKMPSHDEVQDGLRELTEKGDKTAANLLKQTESGRINIRNSAFGRGTLYLKDHGYFRSSGVQFEEAKSLIDKNEEALSGGKAVSAQEAQAAIDRSEAKVELLSRKATIAEAQKLINDKILIEDPGKATEYGMKLNQLQGEEKLKFAQEILIGEGAHKEAALHSLGVSKEDSLNKIYEEADTKAVQGRELLEKEREMELDKEMKKVDSALNQEQIKAKADAIKWEQEQKVFETERAQANQEIEDMFKNLQRRYVDDPENLSKLNKQFDKSESILNKAALDDKLSPEETINKTIKSLDKSNLDFFKKLPHVQEAQTWAQDYSGAGENKVQDALKDLSQAIKSKDSSAYLKAIQRIEDLQSQIEKAEKSGLVGILNKEDVVGEATAKPLDPEVRDRIEVINKEAQQAEIDARAKAAEYARQQEEQEIIKGNNTEEARDLTEQARRVKIDEELSLAEKQSEEAFKDAYKYLDEKQAEVDFARSVNAEKNSFNLQKEIKELEKTSAYLQRANERGVSLDRDDVKDFVTKLEMIKRNSSNDQVLEAIQDAENYLKKGGKVERYIQMVEDAVSQVLRSSKK